MSAAILAVIMQFPLVHFKEIVVQSCSAVEQIDECNEYSSLQATQSSF